MKHLVAVYGSLKKGFGNYSVMESAKGKFITEAITKESNYVMDGYGYPYVVFNDSEHARAVKVEIYEVDDIGLKMHLDRLEGHPTFYKREKLKFITAIRRELEAWMYIYQGDIKANELLIDNDNCYNWQENLVR